MNCLRVQVAILGHLCKEDELKGAAISMMTKEVGLLRNLKDWKKVAGYPELLMEIAEQMKNEAGRVRSLLEED